MSNGCFHHEGEFRSPRHLFSYSQPSQHLLHALESRRHKLPVPDAELDQLLSEVKDARVSISMFKQRVSVSVNNNNLGF